METVRQVEVMDDIRVQATNFQSFTEIAIFQKALRTIPGVSNVRVKPNGNGQIDISLHHEAVLPFEIYLRQLLKSPAHRIPVHITIAIA